MRWYAWIPEYASGVTGLGERWADWREDQRWRNSHACMHAYHMFLDASSSSLFCSLSHPPARLPSIIFSLFMSRPNETTRSIPMLMEYTHRCVGSQPGPVSHQAADELVEPHLEHLVTHAFAALVLDGREGVLDDCFLAGNPKVSSAQFSSHRTPILSPFPPTSSLLRLPT